MDDKCLVSVIKVTTTDGSSAGDSHKIGNARRIKIKAMRPEGETKQGSLVSMRCPDNALTGRVRF